MTQLLAVVPAFLAFVFGLCLLRLVRQCADRVLTLYESRSAVAPQQATAPMPGDIRAWANEWGMPWARDEAAKTAEEHYNKLGDWDAVRTALGLSDAPSRDDA